MLTTLKKNKGGETKKKGGMVGKEIGKECSQQVLRTKRATRDEKQSYK